MNAMQPPQSIEEIKEGLETTEKGGVRQSIRNCLTVFQRDPLLSGAIAYNILTDRKDIIKPIGFHRESTALNDTDMKYLLLYLEETYGLTNEKKIDNAIGIVANENKYHPIRDYLSSLVWDGTERIRFCLRHFLGADADDYTYEALKLFLLGAISRAFQPGCKFEIMLCLVGGQGAGKSTFFRLLAVRDEWFSDDLRKLDDDNVYRKLQGHWIIEMSEMMATANAKSIEEIKSFLSRQKEVYKIPYETHPADRPRQCVFGGTSNALDFLPLDRSGNRRFIPVMVYPEQAEVHILEDEAASRAYIEQMWAEAMEIYRSGRFKLAFSPAMQRYLKEHQRDFMPEDTKAGMIQAYLDKYTGSMFLVTFLVLNTGRTEQELENNVFQASSIAQKHNCNLCRLDFQQEQGLMSSLPLADCQIEIQRGLTTSSTAIFIPFTTQELYQSGKESLYYGLNALSNNLIMVDRKKLKNPNGLILGTPGSGKSFSAKREIANAFLVTDDDIIINDPEGEYSPLVNRLKGQVIKISPNSTQFVNPMDINANYSEEDNPLSLKADFILSLCELVVGGKDGLMPVEKTVIDRCVHLIYRKYFADPCPENMPILEDLQRPAPTGRERSPSCCHRTEIYVKGSLNLFNHRTNVNVNNRIVCYDIKELGKQMKKLGMLVVQDQVWGRVTANRSSGKSTRYYMDEMHLLLKEEQTAAYSVEIWKRFRKWGGIPTGLTQNVKDLLSSREVENIFENSDMIIMLNQAAGDRQILAKQLNISPHQLSYVTHSGEGEGLLFFGNVILPFVDRFPTDLELYRIMTTKLGEVSEGAQK